MSVSTKPPQPTAWGSVPRRPSWWQHQRHQQGNQSKGTETWDSHKLQVPGLSCIWRGFKVWDTLKDNKVDSSIAEVETSLERQEHFSQFQVTTVALPCHICLSVCLWIMDPHNRAARKNTSHRNEVLPQDTTHLIQRTHYQRGSLCQDLAGNRTTWRLPDHRKETQTEVVNGHACC